MAYSDFDLRRVLTDFGLTRREDVPLFADVPDLVPGENLRAWLAEYTPFALGIGTEAARSQFLILPIFAEARRLSGGAFSVLPGVTFDVDRARGLTGVCDYLFSQSRELYFVESPVVAVAEAKREDMVAGIGQCAAAMVAVRLFNERSGQAGRVVHGAVTTGNAWRFLRLEGDALSVDPSEFTLVELPKLLGILVHIGRD